MCECQSANQLFGITGPHIWGTGWHNRIRNVCHNIKNNYTFPLFSLNIKRNQNAKQVEIPEDLMKLG